MNGVLAPDMGIWTEQPVAYRLIALGQDVSYTLPRSIWPSVSAHAALGFTTLAVAALVDRFWRFYGSAETPTVGSPTRIASRSTSHTETEAIAARTP